MDRKIILFELNEVPFKIIDQFRRWRPNSTFAKRYKEFHHYDTYTEEVGHLSPWRTWPSLHRGVHDGKHLIYDFGQDLVDVDKEFPPLWHLLTKAGISTGICGSLHTYPMPTDLQNYSFYLPDTFAAGSECFPEILSLFQAFNLAMVKESARNVSTSVPWSSALKLLAKSPELGFKWSTFMDVGSQLVNERVHNWTKVRRRTYQVVLAFDIFMKQLDKTKPAFTTFFTNHVASSMHRFWAAAFPEDYETFGYDDDWVKTYCHEIDFTMGKFDEFLARLLKWVDANQEYTLWIATSMGQAATQARPLETQLYVDDLHKFMQFLGFDRTQWQRLPAMLPQVNLTVTPTRTEEFERKLQSLEIDGKPVGFRKAANGFFSIDLGHPNLYDKPQKGMFEGREVTFEEMSLKNVEIEDKSGASAYHIPDGALLVYDPRDRSDKTGIARTQISTLDIAPTLLSNYSVQIPEYMRRPVAVAGREPRNRTPSAVRS